MTNHSYWIGVIAQDHAAAGVAGGFAQLAHGRAGPLERMREGDGYACYSPRTAWPTGDPLQAFTAIGRVAGGGIRMAADGSGSPVFRRAVHYRPACAAPVRPLLAALTFIRSKEHWGTAFRFGFLRVPAEDFARIAAAMGRDFARDFPAAEPAPA